MKITQIESEKKVNKRCDELNCSLREQFQYIGVDKTRLKLKCNIDEYEWETRYSNFVNNKTRCPKCSKRVLVKEDIIININNRLNEINATMIEPYVHLNNQSKLKLRCNIDGHEWETKYLNFVNSKRGCSKCANVLKLTQEESEQKVMEQCKVMNYELVKPFIYTTSSKTKITLKCNNCQNVWDVNYNNFISIKSGCPKCNLSKGEIEIEKILNENNIMYITQKTFNGCKDKKHLKFDFYLTEYNICIEFDGIQHFKSFNFFGGTKKLKETQKRDNIKNQYCIDNNIDLIRIPYWEFNNIREIILNIM